MISALGLVSFGKPDKAYEVMTLAVVVLVYALGVEAVVVRFLGRVIFHTLVRPVWRMWRTAIRSALIATGFAVARGVADDGAVSVDAPKT